MQLINSIRYPDDAADAADAQWRQVVRQGSGPQKRHGKRHGCSSGGVPTTLVYTSGAWRFSNAAHRMSSRSSLLSLSSPQPGSFSALSSSPCLQANSRRAIHRCRRQPFGVPTTVQTSSAMASPRGPSGRWQKIYDLLTQQASQKRQLGDQQISSVIADINLSAFGE